MIMETNKTRQETTAIPQYGLIVKLNHVYPEKWSQRAKLKLKQILPLIPLVFRYLIYYIKIIWQGRKVLMDYVHQPIGKQIYGVPIGGIGCGSIGRGYRGEFCRYQLTPGIYEYNTIDANQFIITIKDENNTTILQSVLSTYERSNSKVLKSWKSLIDGSKCQYTGLYPRSWTEYDLSEYGINLICRQISPVIPHNYKDSSLPCAVFVWEIKNICSKSRAVTLTFTFRNGTGDKKDDSRGLCSSEGFTHENIEGVMLNHHIKHMPCTYTLAVKSQNDLNISKCLYFDPNSDGFIPWQQLQENGKFNPENTSEPSLKTDLLEAKTYNEMAVGIAAAVIVKPTENKSIEMTLVWDMPAVNFFSRAKRYKRYYSKFFASEDAPFQIASYGLDEFKNWETAIYQWQSKVLNDSGLPKWYKSALFNELYFVSDGGTVWLTLDDEDLSKLSIADIRNDYGRFAFLEGHEYRMYNTYDVQFYASYALVTNWPLLQISLQYDIKDAIFSEITQLRRSLADGHKCERKKINTVPHDIGDPDEEPFMLINSYPIHDVSEWRDLNLKFVLEVYRDYKLIQTSDHFEGKRYLKDMYMALKMVMDHSTTFDVDDDGLIENSGSADQTYDCWVMKGASAYCGGLWLAALKCMEAISEILNKHEDKKYYRNMLDRGKVSFEKKLWTGTYYQFDSVHKDVIMADQLCGHWYLRCSGFNYEVFPKDKVLLSLRTIFENNVQKFANCEMGAVNGFALGEVDTTAVQSEEIWTGVTYALASMMIHEGMVEEAWLTAGGMYKCLSEQIGMAFETPEAIHAGKWYRAIGYMRPLSIWSMQLAWESRQSEHR